MSAPVGLVGRFVSVEVTRGDSKAREVCEVVACNAAGEYETFRILVATHDGALLSVSYERITLVPAPSTSEGPYR